MVLPGFLNDIGLAIKNTYFEFTRGPQKKKRKLKPIQRKFYKEMKELRLKQERKALKKESKQERKALKRELKREVKREKEIYVEGLLEVSNPYLERLHRE